MTETLTSDESATAVGKRLRRLRMMAGLTRDALSQKANVSKASLSYWENASLNNPLKPRSMHKLLEVFRESGILCDEKWLLTGVGLSPKIIFHQHEKMMHEEPATLLDAEVDLFTSAFNNTVTTKISHDSLSPFLKKDDIVGGKWITEFESIQEECCIVEINGIPDVKILKKINSHQFESFTLKQNIPVLLTPTRIAPILRVWRE